MERRIIKTIMSNTNTKSIPSVTYKVYSKTYTRKDNTTGYRFFTYIDEKPTKLVLAKSVQADLDKVCMLGEKCIEIETNKWFKADDETYLTKDGEERTQPVVVIFGFDKVSIPTKRSK